MGGLLVARTTAKRYAARLDLWDVPCQCSCGHVRVAHLAAYICFLRCVCTAVYRDWLDNAFRQLHVFNDLAPAGIGSLNRRGT
jgi:hypothetical protein